MGDLVKLDTALVSKTPKQLDSYLKPMSRDIYLFTSKIANTYKAKDKALLFELKEGERLEFERVMSKYEDNLIAINNSKMDLLGYVPEADSAIFAKLMEAGKMLFAKVKTTNFSSAVPLISIDIYLRDF